MTDPAADPLVPAAPEDVEPLAELWAQAFPSRGAAERARELREGLTYGTLADCWVARAGGAVVGALRTYRLTLNARGRSWPTLGLAAVAVAPDHRRRGLGRRMCLQALRIGRERGSVLAALYPFRTSFYAQLGFALVGTLHRYRFDPRDLPVYPGWDRVRRAGAGEVRSVYQRAARGSTGLIDRPELAWRVLSDPAVSALVHHDPAGRPSGYLVARVRVRRSGDRLRVVEMLALDQAAHEGLLGWIAAQRDQFQEVVYDALPGEALDRRLRHARRPRSARPRGLWLDTATLLRGPMLRLLAPAAVQADGDGAGFCLLDAELPECAGRWAAGRFAGGAAEARRGEEAMGPGEAAERFLQGTLPGQTPPPAGWQPIPYGEEFRLLDEF